MAKSDNSKLQDDKEAADPAPSADAKNALKELPARFGEIVALLMRSPTYQHMSLADLQWLVIPALLTGQFSIMSARAKSDEALRAPVGLALWASVSADVDRKLQSQQKAGLSPFRLAPKEWRSGDTIWILDLIAAPQVKQTFIDKLISGPLKGRKVKRYFEKIDPPAARVTGSD